MPATTPRTDPTAACVADFVGRVLASTQAASAEQLASTDLTLTQMRTLFVLMESDDALPIHEVAERLKLSLPAAGRAADRLVTMGLIDRREDPRDRRVKLLSLNAAGNDLLVEHLRVRNTDIDALLAPVPGEVRERLRAAVLEVIGYLPDAGPGCTPKAGNG